MKYLPIILFLLLFINPAQADLVSWWKMDEASWNGTASEVVDSYGTNHGTASGGATTKVGKIDRAGSFDGVDDYVTVLDNPSLEGMTQLTITGWIYPTNLTSGDRDIIWKGDHGGGRPYGSWLDWTGTTYRFQFVFTDNELNGVSSAFTYTIQNNTWYHFTVTFIANTTTGIRFYVNGLEVSGSPSSSSTVDNIRTGSGYNVVFGGSTGYYYNGLIDEIRIYNHALTAAEVAQAYYEGANTRLR